MCVVESGICSWQRSGLGMLPGIACSVIARSVIGGFLLDCSPGMQSCICICVQALKRGFCRDTMLLPRANSAEPYSQAVMVTHAVPGWHVFSSLCDTPVNHIKCPDSLGQGDLWHTGLSLHCSSFSRGLTQPWGWPWAQWCRQGVFPPGAGGSGLFQCKGFQFIGGRSGFGAEQSLPTV